MIFIEKSSKTTDFSSNGGLVPASAGALRDLGPDAIRPDEQVRLVPTVNAICESHRFCVAQASYSQDCVVHIGNWKVHRAKMMEQIRSEARVGHFGFQLLRWL